MADHFEDFPYEEIRQADGNYFASWAQACEAGYAENRVWSVVELDGTWAYGPPHDYVNHVGHIATKETHGGDTYYHEEPDLGALLEIAQSGFTVDPSNTTAGDYLAAAMGAENEGVIDNEQFLDHLATIGTGSKPSALKSSRPLKPHWLRKTTSTRRNENDH